jgi:hypothetical protein
MKAKVGDQIIVGTTALDAPERCGQVIEVFEPPDGGYVVRWEDGHQTIYIPQAGARVLEVR